MSMSPKKRESTCMVSFSLFVLAAAIPALAQVAVNSPSPAPPDLAAVRKVCVDRIVGEERIAAAARELAIAGLFESKLFALTEKCDKADAVLKGAVLERIQNKFRGEGETIIFGAGGVAESLSSSEAGYAAAVVLRLVDAEGTIIWAFSQDSPGGKVKGALSDAIDRAVKRLIRDAESARPSKATR